MGKFLSRLILISVVLVIGNSAEIKAEAASTGLIQNSSVSPSSSNNTTVVASPKDVAISTSTSSDTTSSSTTNKNTSAKAVTTSRSKGTVTASEDSPSPANSAGVATNVQSSSVQVEPSSGSAGLSIPITVPAGRAGIQPNLSLIYSSSNRQLGNAGVGWSLDLGSIQISTKKGIPKYDGTDIFTMEQNGSTQDLVADPTISGLYHMEVEGSFANIQYYSASPSYWVITDKKGIKYYYGNTSDSRESDPTNTYTFRWALNRVEDLNGNYMTISYTNAQGQIFYTPNEIDPQTINYTGNDNSSLNLNLSTFAQVNINYVATTSPSISYISKFSVRTTQRIDNISVYVGPNVQSTYTFTYHPSANSQRDLLQSVQQSGSDGTSLPPVSFTYNEALPQWQLASGWTIPSDFTLNMNSSGQILDAGIKSLDLNGDGYPDFLRVAYNKGFISYSYLNNSLNNINKGWTLSNNWTLPSTSEVIMTNFDWGIRLADFDGDGIEDIAQQLGLTNNKANPYTQQFYINNLNGFDNSQNFTMPSGIFFAEWYHALFCIDGSNYCTPHYYETGVVTGDVNGDGFPDLVQSKQNAPYNGQGVYVNQYPQGSSSFSQDTSFTFPSNSAYTDFTQGAELVDLNGDGLADIFYLKGGVAKAYLNNGSGWVETGDYENTFGLGDLTDKSTQLVDVNGDGLPDLVTTTNGDRANATILLNTGSGWSKYQDNIGDFNFFDYGTQFLDANADGMQGYLTYETGGSAELYLNANKPVDLLVGTNNGIGASTSIQYDSGFHYNNTYMPYFIPVVKSTTTTVGSESYTTSYSYAGGLWDKITREFDGFQTVTVTDPQGNYVTTTFDQDPTLAHWLKGHPLEQDTYDSNGNLYSKSVNTWGTQTIATNSASNQTSILPYVSRTDNYLYDGSSTFNRTAQEFTYGENPQYGDITQTINDGQVDPTTGNSIDPNRTVTNVNYVNNTSNWLLGLPSQTITQDTNGNKLSQTSFYYDNDTTGSATPSLGRLSSKVNWLGSASATQPDPKTTYTYDIYGNLKTTTDPNNNITTITYDNTVHMFPVETTNALNQNVLMTYYGIDATPLDNGQGFHGLWGQDSSKTDANNQIAYTTYDTFGRPVSSISPLDSVAFPTEIKYYNIQPTYIAVRDTARVTSGTSATISSVSYYDGLGRLVETKSLGPSTGEYIVSGLTSYDSRGLPMTKYLPYFSSKDLNTPDTIADAISHKDPYSQAVYDPMGRITKKINPDSSYSSIAYDHWRTTTTDENGHEQISQVDAFGRLVQKEEYTGADGRSSNYPTAPFTLYATTTYNYDPKGNLTSVTDAKNNVTTVTYDNLNRKIAMNDPDMGKWQYGYDNNGNLIWQADANNQVISFQYDALNRLKNKTDATNIHPATFNVNYNFDLLNQSYGIGRLGSVTYDTGSAGFIYDQLGREVRSSKNITGTTYNVTRQYDALNRLKQLQYPDGSEVVYTYNQAGQINSVADQRMYNPSTMPASLPPGGNVYVETVDYNANGQITQIQYGNSTATAYTYDPLSFRLTRIYTSNSQAQTIQDLNYTYDSLGQILTITDNVNEGPASMTQSFAYDELNRLVAATGSYGSKVYAYNQIGNITLKDGLTYHYGDFNSRANGLIAGPHAVTSLSDGTIFKYGANGNMSVLIKGNNATRYFYDSQNRLQSVTVGGLKVADYAYDGDGGRIKKTVYRRDLALYNDNTDALLFNILNKPQPATAQNPTIDITSYVGNVYEVENPSRFTKFIYLGSTKVASVNSNVNVFYYHTDHLGGTNVLTDSKGLVRELTEYDPFGQVTIHEKYGSDFSTAWYYFTGKPLDDETGLIFLGARYYNPSLGRFITPDTDVQAPNNPQTLNRYTYCNNNPVNLIDSTGHSWWSKLWKAVTSFFKAAVEAIAYAVLSPIITPVGAGLLVGFVAGGLSGGGGWSWSGAITGAILGGVGGAAFGSTGVNGFLGSAGTSIGMGVLAAGFGYSAYKGGWEGALDFAAGVAGGMAGIAVGNQINIRIADAINSGIVPEGQEAEAAAGARTPIGAQQQSAQTNLTVGQQESVVNGQALSEPSTSTGISVGQIDGIPAGDVNLSNSNAVGQNYQRFISSLPAGSNAPVSIPFGNGSVAFQGTVPATNIPASYAVYEKQVNIYGITENYSKTTYAPDGTIVSVKYKYQRT